MFAPSTGHIVTVGTVCQHFLCVGLFHNSVKYLSCMVSYVNRVCMDNRVKWALILTGVPELMPCPDPFCTLASGPVRQIVISRHCMESSRSISLM